MTRIFKSYYTYKKLNRPYFNLSELIGFPILPIVAIALVSFGILFFVGLTAMLLSNVAIAVVSTFVFHGLKNASPNGSRNVNSGIPGLIVILYLLPTFLVILGVILLTNVGVYIGVTFLQTGIFHELYFYIWLFVLLGVPILYFLISNLNYRFQLYKQAYYFTPLPIHVIYDYELLTTNVTLSFLQTEKKRMSTVAVGTRKDVEHIGTLSTLTVSERNTCLYESVINKTVYIPKGTNRLHVSWYSVLEDLNYEGEIDFPFDKLIYVANKYPLNVPVFLRGKNTDLVTLSILQGGKVLFFNKHQYLLEPIVIPAVAVTEEHKKQKLESLVYVYPVKNVSALIQMIDIIKQSNAIETRAALANYQCNWQITGTGLDGQNIEIKDVKNNYTTTDPLVLNAFEQRRLPIFFKIDYEKNTWLHIYIDAEKLYLLIQSLGDTEPAISFDFKIDLEKGEVDLIVKNKDNILPFTAWEKEITYRWQETKDALLEKKDIDAQNEFLRNIYECIVEKEYVKAEVLCKSALVQFPYFPMIYFYEARLLFYTDGVEACYAKESYFIDKTKNDPYAQAQIYNNYGCLLDEEKRYVESLERFEKAYATYPKQGMYLSNLAETHYKLKHSKKALKYAKECMGKEFASDVIAEIISNNGVIGKSVEYDYDNSIT